MVANRRRISTPLALALVAVAAAAVALVFGATSLDIAKFGAPHNVALQAAQIGVAPAQAAPVAVEAGYLPAQFATLDGEVPPHLESF
jgi:hypothetical protein